MTEPFRLQMPNHACANMFSILISNINARILFTTDILDALNHDETVLGRVYAHLCKPFLLSLSFAYSESLRGYVMRGLDPREEEVWYVR